MNHNTLFDWASYVVGALLGMAWGGVMWVIVVERRQKLLRKFGEHATFQETLADFSLPFTILLCSPIRVLLHLIPKSFAVANSYWELPVTLGILLFLAAFCIANYDVSILNEKSSRRQRQKFG
jgi:hypothetical protein